MIGETRHIRDKYARIYTDMQRFGNFGAGVPEIRSGGLIFLAPATAIGSPRQVS
jgi:hypothetical protein